MYVRGPYMAPDFEPSDTPKVERPQAYLYITFKDGNTATTQCSDLAASIDAARLAKAGVIKKVVIRFTDHSYVTVQSGDV